MTVEHIINIFLDSSFDAKRTAEVEHEYTTAVNDLLKKNSFHLCKNPGGTPIERGPYNLHLSIADGRLLMDVRLMEIVQGKEPIEKMRETVTVPMTPFRSTIKDYFFIMDSYYAAVKGSSPSQIETIDMARRSLHNEGAVIIKDIIHPAIEVDFETARRLFTLVCVLHIR